MATGTPTSEGARDEEPAERPPRTRALPEIDQLAGAPCRCLPDPQGDWLPCAYCGLKQASGKDFCGFCGHRWVTAADA